MVREFAIAIYLFVYRLFFTVFKLFPQKKKSTFVASFGDNILYVVKELERRLDQEIVILKTAQCKIIFKEYSNARVLHFELAKPLQWIRSIFHIATSTTIFVDNYFGFLATSPLKKNVNCIQLWHAAGAIKKFGLKDPAIKKRSKRANKRFNRVYDRFDLIIVGSDNMATIFQESFGVSEQKILKTGIPRTDFFFQKNEIINVVNWLEKKYSLVQGKKVILYAPTFRENEYDIPLNFTEMYNQLKDDFVLLLRLHPSIEKKMLNQFPSFVCDVSDYPLVNHLLCITDILITDYSSVSFEFSLLQRPMIFFAYDLDEYCGVRGIWKPYEETVPGPIVTNTSELIHVIKTEQFNMDNIVRFNKEWNQYSDGSSSEKLILAVYGSFI